MTDMNRRNMLQTAGAMTVGVVAGCATQGVASNAAKTPFSVPVTTVPVVRGDRLDCHIDGLPELSIRIV